MIDDFSIWSVLTFARFALFFAAVFALAVWASRQPDQSSEMVERLTGKRTTPAEEVRCVSGPAGRPASYESMSEQQPKE